MRRLTVAGGGRTAGRRSRSRSSRPRERPWSTWVCRGCLQAQPGLLDRVLGLVHTVQYRERDRKQRQPQLSNSSVRVTRGRRSRLPRTPAWRSSAAPPSSGSPEQRRRYPPRRSCPGCLRQSPTPAGWSGIWNQDQPALHLSMLHLPVGSHHIFQRQAGCNHRPQVARP